MTSRERILYAYDFCAPDRVPIQYHPSPRGYFDYGMKMADLFKKYPGDFGDPTEHVIPKIPPNAYKDGEYYELIRDDWGTLWEYRIFLIQGHPKERPLDDWSNLDNYEFPPIRFNDDKFKNYVKEQKKTTYTMHGGVSFLEKMTALRRFEDVLMDITLDTKEINILADRLLEKYLIELDYLQQAGVECLTCGDDFGTQRSLLLSPATFRRFIKPRYKQIFDKAKKYGMRIHFHSCGANWLILDDLIEIGIDSIWPQLTAYDTYELAKKLRENHVACALHYRGGVMNTGSSDDVVRWVEETSEQFDIKNGGGWYYVVVDDGFPYENTKTLFETIDQLR